MREQRKRELLWSFPSVPDDIKEKMREVGKDAENFVVFLTRGQELYARCFHRYSKGKELVERQRYVFAKDGAVRYGESYDAIEHRYVWKARRNFREPVFHRCNMGYTRDNSYYAVNLEAIRESDMKYFPFDGPDLFMCWLKLYCQHPNVEYLIKSGYEFLFQRVCTGYWGQEEYLLIPKCINWKSNNLLKMLGLNRTEFKLLQGEERKYEDYIRWRKEYPKAKPEALMKAAYAFGSEFGTAAALIEMTRKNIFRIADYIEEQGITTMNYRDYLGQCRTLGYDLHDTAICFPHDFNEMHTRLSAIIRHKEDEKAQAQINERYESRRQFEFSSGGLMVIQPKSFGEIVNEGKVLCHCVGGYAERHAKGQLNIFFIRRASDPDTPYFTIEVDNDYRIKQCHGYRNDRDGKPEEITAFEQEYGRYLDMLRAESQKKQRKGA